MKTAFILAGCMVACLFFMEAHGHPRERPGGPNRPPLPNVNDTGDSSERPRGGRPPGPPRGRPGPPVKGEDFTGRKGPGKHPGGPPRPFPPQVNETGDFNITRPEKRFGGHHDGNKPRNFSGVRYEWTRDLDANTTVREGAGIRNGSEDIFIKSGDPKLDGKGFTRSSSVYIFNNGTGIVIYLLVKRSSPCFVENTTLTYDEVKDDVESKNGTTVETTNKVSKTAYLLSEEEETNLRKPSKFFNSACKGRKIYRLEAASDEPSDADTEKVVILKLNEEITITYPKSTELLAGGKSGKGDKGGRGGKGGQGPRRGYP
ncbi:hypothetical protein BsWGS_07551 [Bradybaena similaris]